MAIGQKIYELRTAKNISQEQLALDLGVSRQVVLKWETDNVYQIWIKLKYQPIILTQQSIIWQMMNKIHLFLRKRMLIQTLIKLTN